MTTPPHTPGPPMPSAPQMPTTPTLPRPEDPATFRLQSVLPGPQRRALRHPGEIPWLVVGFLLNALAVLLVLLMLLAVATGDVAMDETLFQLTVLVVSAPLLLLLVRGYYYAQLRSRAVRITPTQFPDAYRMVAEAAYAAGMRRMPDAYVLSGSGVLNAVAAGHGHRRFVGVHSDLFELGGQARDPQALRFVIAHEVGHLAAGHVAYWRLLLTFLFNQIPVLSQFLSRAQEYTADNYGYQFAPQGAPGAISALAAGKYLNREVDPHEFADRAVREKGLFVWAANLGSSHPLLTWRSHALRDRSRAGRLFLRPRAAVSVPEVLPPGSSRTGPWADPAQALHFLDAHPQRGADTFGGVQVAGPPPQRIWPGRRLDGHSV